MKRHLLSLLFLLGISSTLFSQAPTMSCPGNIITSNAPGLCSQMVTYPAPTCETNCTGTTIYQSDNSGLTSGDIFPGGITTQTYIITNGTDSTSCIFKISVEDVEDPMINCAGNQIGYLNNSCEFIIPDYQSLGLVSGTDNCYIDSIVQSPLPGVIYSGHGTVIPMTFIAYDSSGNDNSCNFDVTIYDTIAPTINNCPTSIVEPATSGCQATLQNYAALISISDNCDVSPTISQSPPSGTTFTTSEEVTLYVTDAYGNIDSCNFTVTTDDIVAPSITCPSNTTVYVDENCDYLIQDFSGQVVATDNCDPSLSYAQSPAAGNKFSGNNTTQSISFTVSDIAGNSSVCSFQVSLVDTIAPKFVTCNDTTLPLNHNCELVLPNLFTYVGVSENCSSIATQQIPIPGTTISGEMSTSVVFSATDVDGNVGVCTLNVISVDTTHPNIVTCPSNQTVSTGSTDCNYEMIDYATSIFATDNCTSALTITQTISEGALLAAGSTYPVRINVADDAGNTSTCDFDITVVDQVNPVINCLPNPSVAVNSNCEYIVPSFDTIVNPTDNCGNITYSQTPIAGTVISGIGTQQSISLYVEDDASNQASCSFTITLTDTTAPEVICPSDQTITIDANCEYIIPDFESLVTFSDFCDASPSYAQSPSIGVTANGIINITIAVEDASGNENTCVFQAIPDDQDAPSINCPDNMGSCNNIFSYNAPVGSDNCGIVTISQTDGSGLSSGSTFPEGVTTLEYTATDEVGNTTTCSFDIEVYPTPTINFDAQNYNISEGDSVQLLTTITNDSAIVWSPAYNLSSDTIASPWASPNASTEYEVYVVSDSGCTATGTVTVLVDQILELTINNFVSPNDDGKNEFWTMSKPSIISGCTVSIYDRWGKLVWETTSYDNQWNGKNQSGEELPDGTYFYHISCIDKDVISGSILLMR